MAMAKGAEVLKGTFTVQDTSGHTINFGKTFSKYFYLVEMTDESKTTLAGLGLSSAKTYAVEGIYPMPGIANKVPTIYGLGIRYNGSSDETTSNTFPVYNSLTDGTKIAFQTAAISGGANNLYVGYTYNYIIVSLDNV